MAKKILSHLSEVGPSLPEDKLKIVGNGLISTNCSPPEPGETRASMEVEDARSPGPALPPDVLRVTSGRDDDQEKQFGPLPPHSLSVSDPDMPFDFDDDLETGEQDSYTSSELNPCDKRVRLRMLLQRTLKNYRVHQKDSKRESVEFQNKIQVLRKLLWRPLDIHSKDSKTNEAKKKTFTNAEIYRKYYDKMIVVNTPWSNHSERIYKEVLAEVGEQQGYPQPSSCMTSFYRIKREEAVINGIKPRGRSQTRKQKVQRRSRSHSADSPIGTPVKTTKKEEKKSKETKPTVSEEDCLRREAEEAEVFSKIEKEVFLLKEDEKAHLRSINSSLKYSSFTNRKPMALVFSSYAYEGRQYRKGGRAEVKRFCKFAETLGYEVEVKENQTGAEMKAILSAFSRSRSHTSRCLLFFSSHGSNYELENYDGSCVEYEWIFSKLACSRNLDGIAKIILFSCCRVYDPRYALIPPAAVCTQNESRHHVDFLILWATSPNHVSGRSNLTGGEFIKVLLDQFKLETAKVGYKGITWISLMQSVTNFLRTHGIPYFDDFDNFVELFNQTPQLYSSLRGDLFIPVFPLENRK